MPFRINPASEFWHDKRVLLTGHTGFKGAWLALWLRRLGAEVVGVGLPPESDPNLFALIGAEGATRSHICDIRDEAALAKVVRVARPDIVLHLAAQALVRAGYREPTSTFSTNVMGTANLLESIRRVDCVRVVVAITTDKVYRNLEFLYPFRENDALGGHDPYSASKAAAELVIASYRDAYLLDRGVAVASARSGNVIGGGDWAADRLIPDLIRAWVSGASADIRRPAAVRPWQHVLEPLAGYLVLAEKLWDSPDLAGAFNFGPETHEAIAVRDVVQMARSAFGEGKVSFGDSNAGPHEAGLLSLEIAKARALLGVEPRWPLNEAVQRAMAWYRKFDAGADAAELCRNDIDDFETEVN